MSTQPGGTAKQPVFLRIDPREIIIDPGFNPRTEMDLEELMPQIAENGVQEPIRVHKRDDGYHLVNGGRRVHACLKLIEQGIPIKDILAIVLYGYISKEDLLFEAVRAHGGKPLTKLEEAEVYRRYIGWGWSQSKICHRFDKPASIVSARLRLLDAKPAVRQAYKEGTIGYTTTLELIRKSSREGRPQEVVLRDMRSLKAASSSKRTRRKRPVLSVVAPQEADKRRLRIVFDNMPDDIVIETMSARLLIKYGAQHASNPSSAGERLSEDGL